MDQDNAVNSTFVSWLKTLGESFSKLSNEEKNKTLDFIIEISQASQLFYLSEKLQILLKRDFLAFLPREICHHLLQYFDPDTLRTCCLVSKTWNESINGCKTAWQNACQYVGVKHSCIQNQQDAQECKQLYLATCARLKTLKMGRAFESSKLWGHTDRVMAITYKDGILATGSDDHTVRLWDCNTGQILHVLHTHTVADIKFTASNIITASFDATAVIWNIETKHAVRQFQGHVAAVFTVDFNEELDVLVTGSADSTVKVWSMWKSDPPELLRSLPQHRSAWIIQVCLYWNKENEFYYILSRDNMSIQMWKMHKLSHKILEMGDWKNPHDDLVAGLQADGPRVIYSTMDPFNICYTVERSLENPDHIVKLKSQEVSRDLFIQSYLGGGDLLDVFLIMDGDQPMVYIIHRESSDILATVPFPLDYRPSKRNSTYCLGSRDWLNGFDSHNDQGLVFATSLRDNTILLLKWRTLPHHRQSDGDLNQPTERYRKT